MASRKIVDLTVSTNEIESRLKLKDFLDVGGVRRDKRGVGSDNNNNHVRRL